MIIPKEVQCRTCQEVFCCAKCRQKHEDGIHQEDAMLRKICYICNDKPFPLRKDTKITPNNLLVVHILREHLPLECNRCRKVFCSLEDFQNINKCFLLCSNDSGRESECHLESTGTTVGPLSLPANGDENKENVANDRSGMDERAAAMPTRERRKSSLVPGDFVPFGEVDNKIEEVDEAVLTPLTKINLRWKRKSRQSFESMLSMSNNQNNTSEVNASGMLGRYPDGGGCGGGAGSRKLVRTTSTPMYQWQVMPTGPKQPNESYSATMGQMSSIHCSSGSETDSRAEDLGASPPTVPNELDKVRAIIRNRSKAVATPLRQVMSKSIQRAIAQHTAGMGGVYSKMLQPGTQRKMSFNSTMSSGMNSMLAASPSKDPLDLRTTPALKRIGSMGATMSGRSTQAQRMVRPGERSGRDAVQLERADAIPNPNATDGSEYYETHRDLESLHGSGASALARSENNLRKLYAAESFPVTPKHGSGAALKKVSSFQALQEMKMREEQQSRHGADDTAEDVWGTPCGSIPARSYSCSAVGLGDTFKAYDASVEDAENDSASDEVFYPVPVKARPNIRQDNGGSRDRNGDGPSHEGKGKLEGSNGTGRSGGKLWSIVSNVIRLASRSDVQEEHSMGGAGRVAAGTNTGGGIIQRAASFADYLKNRYTRSDGAVSRTSSSGSEEYRITHESNGKKRRRVASSYAYATAMAAAAPPAAVSKLQQSPVAKRKRIQSRQPIQRMRNTSSGSGGSGSGNGHGWYN